MHETLVRYQKGVGPKIASVLSRLGIETIEDLIYFFPREYEDRRDPVAVSKLVIGQNLLVKVRIEKIRAIRTKRNFSIIRAIAGDASGKVEVIWFNQPYLLKIVKPGSTLFITGKLDKDPYSGQVLFFPKDYEVIDLEKKLDLIIPRYPLTEGMTQKMLRRLIKASLVENLDKVKDALPVEITGKFNLPPLKESILNLHFPDDMKVIMNARRRLAFEELLRFELGLLANKKIVAENKGINFVTEGKLTSAFLERLPYKYTGAQQRVVRDIVGDMGSKKVMSRLLQGDVGSGKTVVALHAMLIAVQSGYQAAIMAPTEILAGQHHRKISEMVKGLGVDVHLLTGSQKMDLKTLKGTKPYIIVGTHALLEETITFGKLGIAVIDEQHRFGVDQRLKLRQKNKNVDLLVMTATPIPRTLALTLYGDLDRSVIDEMPPGRTKIVTRYVEEKDRSKLYEFMRGQVSKGRQAFIVCPLIEESESLDVKAAEEELKSIKKLYPEFKVGLMHGRMKAEAKEKTMAQFLKGKINILVSTTVIEVGIDIANATIMLIEHSERFGLSQLHQLRGRIGRGAEQSYCFLTGELKTESSKARVEAMLATTDGFKIAEADLRLRGPGEFFGVSQSGLPNFRVADIIRDEDIIRDAREAASILLQKGADLNDFNIKFWGKKLD